MQIQSQINNRRNRPSRAALIMEYQGRLHIASKKVRQLSKEKAEGGRVSECEFNNALNKLNRAKAQWGVAKLARF